MNRSCKTVRHHELSVQTDLCVKCGLCLPHCPTYTNSFDENESPRGRLALIQAWANEDLPLDLKLEQRIENCLLCRSCEASCPAQVPYGQIIDTFRSEAFKSKSIWSQGLVSLILRKILTTEYLASTAIRLANNLRLRKIGRSFFPSRIAKLILGLPKPGRFGQRPQSNPLTSEPKAELFLGCTYKLLDSETLDASLFVMDKLGIEINIPNQQTCCGALHQHAGDVKKAMNCAEANIDAFSKNPHQPLLSFASGCAAKLKDYPKSVETEQSDTFSSKVMDISKFLNNVQWPEHLNLERSFSGVYLHSPCSLRNTLKSDRDSMELLRKIPGLVIKPLSSKIKCCGAAGTYMISHTNMANALRDQVLDEIVDHEVKTLVTSNPGCAMHLRAGLAERGLDNIEVTHPVTLIARQLGYQPPEL